MENENIYEKAEKKVEAKKGFFYHFLIYALVIGMLYFIICYESGGPLLPVVVVGLSWGIGLGIHYLKSFGTEQLDFLGFEADWEEEELEKEVNKLERIRRLKERINNEKQLIKDLDSEARSESLELKEIVKRPLKNDRNGEF